MNRKLTFISILVGVCLAVGVYTLNFARGKKPSIPQTKQIANYPSEVTSCAKQIKVIKAEIIDGGTSDEVINVQVENLSDLGIIAVSLEATRGRSSYITTLRSSFKEDKPQVVIKPHDIGNLTMTSPFGVVPLQIGGVMYDDGTEDGCVSSLKTLHEVKDSEKKKEPLNETNTPSPNSRNR
jgi:hypothetical protein